MTFELNVTTHAKRGFARLPDKVKPAVWEFLHAPLVVNPQRCGSRLRDPPLEGTWRAKRGEYVVLYDVDGTTVSVVRIEHRRTVYDNPLPQ